MQSIIERCANCNSTHLVRDEADLSLCVTCGATLCEHCDQVMETYQKDDDTIDWRHERADLKAPRCPAHKAELVRERRSQMRLIRGGAA